MASSSKEAEFISQWNGLLDFKINEENLRRPNFNFFYRALESLLRNLNFNIDSARNEASNNPDAERLYFIKFCGFVNRLYQLSDSSFNFYYLDLMNPTPKKGIHVLKTLFNYFKYYVMVKETVCVNANEALSCYNEELATNNQLQVKNEIAKQRAASMELQLEEYERKLPELQERVNQCITEVHTLDKEIAQKNSDIKNFDSTVIKLEIKQSDVGETLVSEEEYNARVETIVALKQELSDLREVAEHVRTSNVGSSAKICELSRTLEIVNKALEEQKLSDYDELISIDSDLETKRKKIDKEEQRITELTANMKLLIENTEDILSQTKRIENNTDKIQSDSDAQSDELIRIVSYHEENFELANKELLHVKSRIEELKQQHHVIVNSILKMLQSLTTSFSQPAKRII